MSRHVLCSKRRDQMHSFPHPNRPGQSSAPAREQQARGMLHESKRARAPALTKLGGATPREGKKRACASPSAALRGSSVDTGVVPRNAHWPSPAPLPTLSLSNPDHVTAPELFGSE